MLTIAAGKGRVLLTGTNGEIPNLSELIEVRILSAPGISFAKNGGSHEVDPRSPQSELRPVASQRATGNFRRVPVLGRCPSVEV